MLARQEILPLLRATWKLQNQPPFYTHMVQQNEPLKNASDIGCSIAQLHNCHVSLLDGTGKLGSIQVPNKDLLEFYGSSIIQSVKDVMQLGSTIVLHQPEPRSGRIS